MSNDSSGLAFSRFLKYWRNIHGYSQEQLAFELDSSPRHISRLENSNSRPSESLVLEIAKAFKLGKRDSNHFLLSAGFIPAETMVDIFSDEYRWLRKVMTLNLRALDPHPAALLDSSNNILMVNRAWVGFYSRSIPKPILDEVTNHHNFLFNPVFADNILRDWDNTLSVILMTLQQKALFSDVEADYELVKKLSHHPHVPEDWELRAANLEPMSSFRVQIDIDGALKRFYSVSSTIGASGPTAYVSEPRLTLNTLFPEDESIDLSSIASGELSHPLLYY